MRLDAELKAYEISETPAAFRKRLIDTLLKQLPGRSIDSIVCRPSDAAKYCDSIREQVASNPPDVVILKTLMNLRKTKSCPTGLKSLTRRRPLEVKLTELGSRLGVDEFRDLVNDCLADMYKSQTIDGLLCHPVEAAALCRYVRARGKCPELTDELILVTLMNNRKAA